VARRVKTTKQDLLSFKNNSFKISYITNGDVHLRRKVDAFMTSYCVLFQVMATQ